jgi:Holliday junction resolvase RusA-like endonuclease
VGGWVLKLTLSLPCPQNRRQRPGFAGGKPFMYLSKECREKRKRLVAEVWKQLGGKPEAMTGPCQINCTMWAATKKTPDLDAFLKELYDGLAVAGVVLNDKQFVHGTNERMPEPAYPGRMEVEIWEICES